jgi:hypothetical protein
MADEQATAPEIAQATPASAPEQDTAPAVEVPVDIPEVGEDAGTDADQPIDGEPTAEELDELDFGFKKYSVPKPLKEAVEDLRASVTKKTQEIAREKKELEAARLKQSEADEQELDARASLRGLDARLAEYAKLTPADWDHHATTNPAETDRAWRDYQLLKEQRGEVAKTLDTRKTERTQAAQQDFAKRQEETRTFAQTKIPGWSPDIDAKIRDYALSKGITEEFIRTNLSPVVYDVMHKAWVGEQALSKQTAAAKPLPVQPLTAVRGSSTTAAGRSLADLAKSDNVEAFVKAREAGRVR